MTPDAGGPPLPELTAVHDQHAVPVDDAHELGQRVPEDVVEDDVVALWALGEVLARVVDDVVGAERADQLELAGAADAGHLGAHRLGDLHGEGADAAAGARDEDLLAGPDAGYVAQRPEGGEPGHRHGRGLLEGEPRGLRHQLVRRGRRDLREGAGLRIHLPEDLVPDLEAGHVPADLLHDPGQVGAAHPSARPAQPEVRTGDVGHSRHAGDVRRVHAGGAHAHEHAALLEPRPLDLLEPQNVWRAVLILDDRLHGSPPTGLSAGAALCRSAACLCSGVLNPFAISQPASTISWTPIGSASTTLPPPYILSSPKAKTMPTPAKPQTDSHRGTRRDRYSRKYSSRPPRPNTTGFSGKAHSCNACSRAPEETRWAAAEASAPTRTYSRLTDTSSSRLTTVTRRVTASRILHADVAEGDPLAVAFEDREEERRDEHDRDAAGDQQEGARDHLVTLRGDAGQVVRRVQGAARQGRAQQRGRGRDHVQDAYGDRRLSVGLRLRVHGEFLVMVGTRGRHSTVRRICSMDVVRERSSETSAATRCWASSVVSASCS